MEQLRYLAFALVLCAVTCLAPLTQAQKVTDFKKNSESKILLRASANQVERLSEQYDLTLLKQFKQGDESVFLAATENIPIDQMRDLLITDTDVFSVEAADLASLPSLGGEFANELHESHAISDLLRVGTFSSPCFKAEDEVWSGYADQQAAMMIGLHDAHRDSPDCGAAATIAVIDTAVDVDHPVLRDVMVPGFDFRSNEPGAIQSDGGLDQSVMAILELNSDEVVLGQGNIVMLDASVAPIVGPDLASALENTELPPFFGHGTMVAGAIRFVAPKARIMPLAVFDDYGSADVFEVVRAIYYAVDHGADIINMSFSVETPSKELRDAIFYALTRGVVCVAAAGNQGEQTRVYPAALLSTVGVASVDQQEQLAAFSNYGQALVSLAAPGVAIVSTFPNGHYAAGWGTSFSAPIAAGTLALIETFVPSQDILSVIAKRYILSKSSVRLEDLGSDIGSGRLDAANVLDLFED